MRKIAANLVFPVSSPPIKNGYVVLSDEGEVLDVCGGGETLNEIAGLEYYSGILVPGFVNAHCHLELSHLKGQIPEGIGLSDFIKKGIHLREQPAAIIEAEAQKAIRYLWSRGINAIGNVMMENQFQMCLATNNQASNHKLSILDEMITLQQHFPKIAFHEILLWATLNGAKALGMENYLGSFEKGKKPGVLLITGLDFKNHRLNPSAEVTRLV